VTRTLEAVDDPGEVRGERCSSCGAALLHEARFCAVCGAYVRAQPALADPDGDRGPPVLAGAPPTPDRPATRTRLVVGLGLAVLLVLLVGIAVSRTPPASHAGADGSAAGRTSPEDAGAATNEGQQDGRAADGPDGPRTRGVPARALEPACAPSGCELWRATFTGDGTAAIAASAERVATIDGTTIVVRDAETGRPLVTTELASAPDPGGEDTTPLAALADDGSLAVARGRGLTVLDAFGETRWSIELASPIRTLVVAGGTVVTATDAPPDGRTGDDTTHLEGRDLDAGELAWERRALVRRVDTDVAVYEDAEEVGAIDLATGETRWKRAIATGIRVRVDADVVLLQRASDAEILAFDGTVLGTPHGTIRGLAATPDGLVVVTTAAPAARTEVGRDGAPPAGGVPSRGTVLLLGDDPDAGPVWQRPLGDLLVDAGALSLGGPDVLVPCCPRLFPSTGPAGVLLEVIDDVGVVLAAATGETVATGDADALQRELFASTLTSSGQLTLRRTADRWELVDGEGELSITGARSLVSRDPLLVRSGSTLLAVRPVTDGG
jgi:outer membrane protein assembly factor BamB